MLLLRQQRRRRRRGAAGQQRQHLQGACGLERAAGLRDTARHDALLPPKARLQRTCALSCLHACFQSCSGATAGTPRPSLRGQAARAPVRASAAGSGRAPAPGCPLGAASAGSACPGAPPAPSRPLAAGPPARPAPPWLLASGHRDHHLLVWLLLLLLLLLLTASPSLLSSALHGGIRGHPHGGAALRGCRSAPRCESRAAHCDRVLFAEARARASSSAAGPKSDSSQQVGNFDAQKSPHPDRGTRARKVLLQACWLSA